jgi:hypothetical protein
MDRRLPQEELNFDGIVLRSASLIALDSAKIGMYAEVASWKYLQERMYETQSSIPVFFIKSAVSITLWTGHHMALSPEFTRQGSADPWPL